MRILTNEQLRHFSGVHLAHELEMFFSMVAELVMLEPKFRDCVQNAMIGALTTHARSLLFFFYSKNPKPDDALADHFMLPGTIWAKVRPAPTPILLSLQTRVGKEIAHLTYSRVDLFHTQVGWDFSGILVDLFPVFRAFSLAADPEKLNGKFDEIINKWLNLFVKGKVLRATD